VDANPTKEKAKAKARVEKAVPMVVEEAVPPQGDKGTTTPPKWQVTTLVVIITCQTKGCNETVGWSRKDSKYFQHCQGCARASPTRKVNANKAGVSFNVVLPNGGTESVMIDANQARLLNLAQSGAQFTMASDADEDHLTKFEKNNSSQ
jgi:hypothetical protein